MKCLTYLFTSTLMIMLIACLVGCSTVKQANGTIATSLLGNVVLADGTSISHESANKTVTKLGMTNIITGGVRSVAKTGADLLKGKDDNKVITGSNNNNLTGKLDDNTTQLELERIKSQLEIKKLELTTPIEP